MPHSCRIRTPYRSSNVFIIDFGTADPPQPTTRNDEKS